MTTEQVERVRTALRSFAGTEGVGVRDYAGWTRALTEDGLIVRLVDADGDDPPRVSVQGHVDPRGPAPAILAAVLAALAGDDGEGRGGG